MIYWPQTNEEWQFLLQWASERIGVNSILYPQPVGVMSKNGEMLAVAIYHEYRKTDIQFSMAADTPRWATRQNLVELAAYPFDVLDVRRMTAMTDKKNKAARRILQFAGFKLEGVLRDATEQGALCVYGMTRSDFEGLRDRHGNTKRTEANAEQTGRAAAVTGGDVSNRTGRGPVQRLPDATAGYIQRPATARH